MCHLQDVCDESSEFTRSFIERVWRSFRIRCRMLKLALFRLKERIRKLLALKSESRSSNTEISTEKSSTNLKPGDMVRVRPFYEIRRKRI